MEWALDNTLPLRRIRQLEEMGLTRTSVDMRLYGIARLRNGRTGCWLARNLVAIGRAGLLNYTQADFGSTVPYGGLKTDKRNQVVPFHRSF